MISNFNNSEVYNNNIGVNNGIYIKIDVHLLGLHSALEIKGFWCDGSAGDNMPKYKKKKKSFKTQSSKAFDLLKLVGL